MWQAHLIVYLRAAMSTIRALIGSLAMQILTGIHKTYSVAADAAVAAKEVGDCWPCCALRQTNGASLLNNKPLEELAQVSRPAAACTRLRRFMSFWLCDLIILLQALQLDASGSELMTSRWRSRELSESMTGFLVDVCRRSYALQCLKFSLLCPRQGFERHHAACMHMTSSHVLQYCYFEWSKFKRSRSGKPGHSKSKDDTSSSRLDMSCFGQ